MMAMLAAEGWKKVETAGPTQNAKLDRCQCRQQPEDSAGLLQLHDHVPVHKVAPRPLVDNRVVLSHCTERRKGHSLEEGLSAAVDYVHVEHRLSNNTA